MCESEREIDLQNDREIDTELRTPLKPCTWKPWLRRKDIHYLGSFCYGNEDRNMKRKRADPEREMDREIDRD